MVSAEKFREIALSLEGTTEAAHFDRRAFRVRRNFATLAADGRSANLRLMPDEQEFKCMLAPEYYSAIDNGWGRQGWTTLDLAAPAEEVRAGLEMAWSHAIGKSKA